MQTRAIAVGGAIFPSAPATHAPKLPQSGKDENKI
jgi:hypothetical protein